MAMLMNIDGKYPINQPLFGEQVAFLAILVTINFHFTIKIK
jgi:hypothetical protein